ncbi:MAG: SURF1 family cytochrome oxidase biogenesis protein [Hyphomonadaceae bacterium]
MISFRPFLVMTVFTVLALALLVALGRWQWEKYDAKVAAAEEPVPEMTLQNYTPIESGIQFVHGVRPDTHEQGWRVFAPVQYGDNTVFIDADFIPEITPPNPDEVRFPAALRLGAPISGASIRPEELSPLASALSPPRPLQRLWFAIDLAAMGRNAGIENVADYYVTANYVGADGRAAANPFALAPGVDPLPPARHLGYAITWYGLAVVLLGVYFAFHVSAGRLKFARPTSPES